MEITPIVLNVAGATMLLLFGVRTVQIGVERCLGPSFRSVFSRKRNRLQSAVAGMTIAVVLQSSAAVALLSVSFASASVLEFSTALAALLGADLGSALVVQLLSFELDWIVPLLLAAGGWLYLHSKSDLSRQAGRSMLGIALILISLGFLREAFEPIRNSSLFPWFATYLERDLVTAFLLGVGLAFLMHSSVAVVLMCAAAVDIGAIPFEAGLSLTLGANFGSSLLPIWLSRRFDQVARRIPYANFAIRGSLAVLALVALIHFGPVPELLFGSPDQSLIAFHLAFNGVLLLALPFLGFLEWPVALLLPERSAKDSSGKRVEEISCLDANVTNFPNLALASVRREVLRMSRYVAAMVHPVLDLYRNGDSDCIDQIREHDQHLNRALSDIRQYVASLPFEKMTKSEKRQARDLTGIAVDLEAAGDIVVRQLLQFAEHIGEEQIRFSDEGWSELAELYSKVRKNMELVFDTLATDDVDIARLVVQEKAIVRKIERNSRKRHFKRLQMGMDVSFDSSDMHLETLRALKELNAKLASVCYPVLVRQGQLRDTRLVDDLALGTSGTGSSRAW